jgi:signal transduction histidine kinase
LALSWCFLLAPIYLNSQETLLGRLENLSFPVWGLAVLFGLSVLWLRYREYATGRAVVVLLIAAITCLVVADFWDAALMLNTASYPSGSPPDLFWLASGLLLLLAGLVRFRLAQHVHASVSEWQLSQQPARLRRQDLIAVIQNTLPMAAVLLTSAVLLIRAYLGVNSVLPSPVPLLIVLFLLVMALVRQALTVAENERLRREREASLRMAAEEMETFLGIAGHELKNPLAGMKLCQQVAARRIQQLIRREPAIASTLEPVRDPAERAEHLEERLDQLVNDLLGVSRVRAGKLELHLEPMDLVGMVHEAVEE